MTRSARLCTVFLLTGSLLSIMPTAEACTTCSGYFNNLSACPASDTWFTVAMSTCPGFERLQLSLPAQTTDWSLEFDWSATRDCSVSPGCVRSTGGIDFGFSNGPGTGWNIEWKTATGSTNCVGALPNGCNNIQSAGGTTPCPGEPGTGFLQPNTGGSISGHEIWQFTKTGTIFTTTDGLGNTCTTTSQSPGAATWSLIQWSCVGLSCTFTNLIYNPNDGHTFTLPTASTKVSPSEFDAGLKAAVAGLGFVTPNSQFFFALLLIGLATVAGAFGTSWMGEGPMRTWIIHGSAGLIGIFCVILQFFALWEYVLAVVLSTVGLRGSKDAVNTYRSLATYRARARGPRSVDIGPPGPQVDVSQVGRHLGVDAEHEPAAAAQVQVTPPAPSAGGDE